MIKSKMKLGAVLCCLIVSFVSLETHAAEEVRSPRIADTDLVDGWVSGASWEKLPVYQVSHILGKAQPAPVGTEFQIAHDDHALYLRIVCEEPTGKVKARELERDSHHEIYHDDSIEVFLAPGTQRTDYYHYQVNAAGVLADSRGRQSGTVREESWGSDYQAKVSHEGKQWTVELILPFADMELADAEEMPWGINVVRVRRAGKVELFTYAPMAGGFHQPANFAPLILEDADFHRRYLNLTGPLNASVMAPESDVYYYQGGIEVTNRGEHVVPVWIEATLVSEDGSRSTYESTGVLNPGVPELFSFEIPVVEMGKRLLVLEVMDRRMREEPLVRTIQTVELTYNPMRLEMYAPAYKDAIFATQALKEIRGVLHFSLSEENLKQSQVELVFRSSGGEILARGELNKLAEDRRFRLDIPELEVGDYELQATLRRGSDEVSVRRRIRKLSPAPSGIEWRIDNEGVLLRNGESFLPIGWFNLSAKQLEEYLGIFNVTWRYWGPWQSVDNLRKRLDEIAEAGGYLVLYPTVNAVRPEKLTESFISERDEQAIRERVRALRDHPALLAWALADEPEYHNVIPEALRQLYEIISDEDPYHPTLVINNTYAAIRRYARGGDILSPDPYPFFKQGGGSTGIGRVGQFVEEAVLSTEVGQSVWVIPQGHDTRDFGGEGERAPTFVELRNMSWQAILAGAKGVVWWSWSHVYPNLTHSVLGTPYIAREISLLEDYVLAPDAGGVSVSGMGIEDLRVGRRVSGNGEMVGVVNTAYAPRSYKLNVPSWRGREVYVLGEDRNVTVSGSGELEERLPAYGTRIYLTEKPSGKFEDLSTIQEKIDGLVASLKRPDNLAHESNGTKILASSRGSYRPGPVWMLDGMRDGRSWSAADFKGEDFVEITWPQSVRAGKVLVFTETIDKIELEGQQSAGGDFVPINSRVKRLDNCLELTFTPTEFHRLKLRITGLSKGAKASQISEIEVYAQ